MLVALIIPDKEAMYNGDPEISLCGGEFYPDEDHIYFRVNIWIEEYSRFLLAHPEKSEEIIAFFKRIEMLDDEVWANCPNEIPLEKKYDFYAVYVRDILKEIASKLGLEYTED